MFSRVRVAIRFFFVGLAVGVLLAPRSGVETRRLLRQRADRLLNDLLDAATLSVRQPASSSGNGEFARGEPAEAPKAAEETSPSGVTGGD